MICLFIFVHTFKNDTKMEYSKEIVKAYDNCIKKQDSEVQEEWNPKYKSSRLAVKRAFDKFEKLCKEQGFNYCDVYKELMGSLSIKGFGINSDKTLTL